MLLEEIFEAKIPAAKTGAAMSKVISYLEKQMGFKLKKLWTEQFKNSKGSGFGVRYIETGTANCIRFNWVGSKSANIVSVDLWNGTSHDPNFNIEFKDVSLAQSLPALVQVLKSPKAGRVKVMAELTEAKKGEFTPESAVADMIEKLESGRSFNRSEFVMNYHPENAYAYDEFVEKFKDELVISGKRISIPKGTALGASKGKGKGGKAAGELLVSKGGTGEQYNVPEADRVEAEADHVSFSDTLAHLESLAQGLIKGAFNALFVAGKGGTGKTQTIEDTLAKAGLSDGAGYFKITGSASPIGIYEALFRNRDGIVLFDDCDGALESQDGRNIIKAATDTKKSRKIAWSKRSSGMYDPDMEQPKTAADDDAENEDGNDEEEPEDTRLPKHFLFTGKVIFISNLPLNKLDPDGALRTRAYVIAVNPTPEELFNHMDKIKNHIRLEAGSLDMKEREHVMKVVRSSKRANDASLRTLVRALNLAASGVPNWEKLVQLYA